MIIGCCFSSVEILDETISDLASSLNFDKVVLAKFVNAILECGVKKNSS